MILRILLRFTFALFCLTGLIIGFKWSVDICVSDPDVSRIFSARKDMVERAYCQHLNRWHSTAIYGANIQNMSYADVDAMNATSVHPFTKYFWKVDLRYPTVLLSKVPKETPNIVALILLTIGISFMLALIWEWLNSALGSAEIAANVSIAPEEAREYVINSRAGPDRTREIVTADMLTSYLGSRVGSASAVEGVVQSFRPLTRSNSR